MRMNMERFQWILVTATLAITFIVRLFLHGYFWWYWVVVPATAFFLFFIIIQLTKEVSRSITLAIVIGAILIGFFS